jgi:C-terminal processing protease CtpA/Prc
MHMTVAKYMTIVGKAVELAGIMPEINKLNITIERRIVISTRDDILVKMCHQLTMKISYVESTFHHCPVARESQVQS